MKKIQLFFMFNIFCSFCGLSAADKFVLINDTGLDMYFRIRSQQDPHNILTLHPDREELEAIHATEQSIKEITNPVAGNPEIFLFKSNSVLSIPVERLYADMRIRAWETDYTPTFDGPTRTSDSNKKNSIFSYIRDKVEVRDFPREVQVYSIQFNTAGKITFVNKDTDTFISEVRGEKYPLIIDLEATKLEEVEEYARKGK
jgi:hypothetical protein